MIETTKINDSISEIYVGGGKFITQAAPTNFHHFFTRKTIAAGDDIALYKEVTAAEKNKLEKSDSAWERPPQLFIDMWNERCTLRDMYQNKRMIGQYNEESGYFELNGLTDISYSQAREIYQAGEIRAAEQVAWWNAATKNLRTNFPPRSSMTLTPPNAQILFNHRFFTVLNLGENYGGEVEQTVTYGSVVYATALSKMIGILNIQTTYPQFGNSSLGEGHVKIGKKGIEAAFIAKNFSFESWQWLVDNSVECTVKIEATAFAKFSGDTTNATVAAMSEEERAQWMQLAADAADKGIIFASY